MSTLSTTNLKNPSSASNNIVLASDGSATIATLNSTTITGTIKSGTAVASTSGTSIDFTSIPSWAKRVTVMFNGVSLSGTSNLLVQLGTSSGVESTGYGSASLSGSTTVSTDTSTAGFIVSMGGAAITINGHLIITNVSSQSWIQSHTIARSDAASIRVGGGAKTLSNTLDRIRITTVNGTDTFDAGTINIMYEG